MSTKKRICDSDEGNRKSCCLTLNLNREMTAISLIDKSWDSKDDHLYHNCMVLLVYKLTYLVCIVHAHGDTCTIKIMNNMNNGRFTCARRGKLHFQFPSFWDQEVCCFILQIIFKNIYQTAFTCSKSIMETPEQCVKYVQS